MIDYINNILPKINKLSQRLDALSKLQGEPWVVLNDSSKIQKLIFQSNDELIVSTNGVVSIGKWKYLVQANSILIDVNDEKRLYNHQFVDNAIMIWKLDGTISEYFMLANENLVPNLDIVRYIERKYIDKNNYNFINTKAILTKKIELINGDKIEIYTDDNVYEGKEVMLNNSKPENGIYKSTEFKRYEINEAKFCMNISLKP